MTGFVAAYREAIDHPLFVGNAERLGAWMWLVMKAAWKPTPFDISGKIVTIERGQVCVSRSQLSTAWGMKPSAVERFLTRLETEQMIGRATGQGRSIITICNYSKYQDISDEAGQATGQATGQPSDSHRTTKEQGNKGTRDIEPNGPISQGAGAPANEPAKKSRAKSGAKWSTIDCPEDITPEVWRDFEQHRRSKDAPITETVMKAIRREAEKVGWTTEQAITETILRNWQGFKSEWVKGNGTGFNHGANGTEPVTHNPMVQAIAAARAKRASGEPELPESDAGSWP